jgi:hypothetical protein
MSIIYSYPTTQPTVDDLLIGTDVGDDNATKSFTVQSLVSLINAQAGSGTLTGVTISTDAFLTAVGNPTGPAVAYTIGLAATGTPSTATFLRGDNQWVTPTVSAGISIQDENFTITDDVSSINFVGDGVSVNQGALGEINVNILGTTSSVDSVSAGTGIGVNQTTGDIIISNTGVTGLTPGPNISLTAGTGSIEIGVTGISSGVTIVQPGSGLVLESGTTTSNPIIGIDYDGADTYITLQDAGIPIETDTIPFQKGTSGVRKVTFGDIQASTLALLNTSIIDSISNVVKYDTPAPTAANLSPFTFPSLPNVRNVVTLTDLEYTNLTTKDGNTLYLTATTGVTQYTKTLVIDSSGITGTQYVLTLDQVGDQKVGVLNSAYAFVTGITLNTGYQWASGAPTINNANGTFTSTGTVTTNLGTGTIQAIPAGIGIAKVTISTQGTFTPSGGAILNTDYEILAAGSAVVFTDELRGAAPFSYTSTNFGVIARLKAGAPGGGANEWAITGSYAYNPASGTVSSNVTDPVTCVVTGSIAKIPYNFEYVTSDTNTTGYTVTTVVNGTGITTNGASGAPNNPVVITGNYGTTVTSIVTTYTPTTGNSVTISGATVTSPPTAAITANTVTVTNIPSISNTSADITVAVNSTTGATSGTARLNPVTNSILSPGGTGVVEGYTAQAQYKIDSGSWIDYNTNNTVTGNNGQFVYFRYVFALINNQYTIQQTLAFSTITPIEINGTNQTRAITLTGTVINALTEVIYATDMQGSSTLACADYNVSSSTYYFDGSGTYPAQGDKIYSNAIGTTALVNGFYAFYYGSATPATINVTGGAGQISAAPVSCPTTGTATLTTTNNINPNDQSTYTATPQYKIGNGAWINGYTITANIGQVIYFRYVFSINPGYTESNGLNFTTINSVTIVSGTTSRATTLSGTVIAQLPGIYQASNQNTTRAFACASGQGFATYYFDGSGTYPTNGENVYEDNAGQIPLNPSASARFYAYNGTASSQTVTMQVVNGVISGFPSIC